MVEFSEHDEALKAIKVLNDTKLDGRYIYIREVKIYYKRTEILKEEKNLIGTFLTFFAFPFKTYLDWFRPYLLSFFRTTSVSSRPQRITRAANAKGPGKRAKAEAGVDPTQEKNTRTIRKRKKRRNTRKPPKAPKRSIKINPNLNQNRSNPSPSRGPSQRASAGNARSRPSSKSMTALITIIMLITMLTTTGVRWRSRNLFQATKTRTQRREVIFLFYFNHFNFLFLKYIYIKLLSFLNNMFLLKFYKANLS